MEFTDRYTEAFAKLNGWVQHTDRLFTFDQLAGRAKTCNYMAAPLVCYSGTGGVLDHLFWFPRERKPVAVVSMPYHGNRKAAQQYAAQYGLIMLAPPIVNAGWWLPGQNGTECFVFVRQGTEVRWLPGQESENAYKEFVDEFNRERHEAFERRRAVEAAKQQKRYG
jgi:hypothetical protein